MKYKKIGEIINIVDERNKENIFDNVYGLKINKTFSPTINKSDDLSNYKIIRKNYFAWNGIQVGRDGTLPVALSTNESPFLVTSAYKTFTVNEEAGLKPEYLMSFFQNPEFDRYLWFISIGGIRSELNWDRFLEIDIPISDDINIQKSVSSAWLSIRKNIDTIEQQLLYIEVLLSNYFSYILNNFESVCIGEFINTADELNSNNELSKSDVKGILKTKEYAKTRANLTGIDLKKYKIIRKNYFACNLMHVGRDAILPIALSSEEKPFLVSPAYKVFTINKHSNFQNEYLMSFFRNREFDRYLWFVSDTGIRGELKWERFLEVNIPKPSIEIQTQVANLEKNINELKRLKSFYEVLIGKLSPTLFSGIRTQII
jgi:type I restriction enzyme, S subunit